MRNIETVTFADWLDTPVIHDATKFGKLLDGWEPERRLLFCDEGGDARPVLDALTAPEIRPALNQVGAQLTVQAREWYLADVIQIGARNMQNFSLLTEVGKTRKPVLLKRGMSATVVDLLMSAEYSVAMSSPTN